MKGAERTHAFALSALVLGWLFVSLGAVRAEDAEGQWNAVVMLEQNEQADPPGERRGKRSRGRRHARDVGRSYRDLRASWHAPPGADVLGAVPTTPEPPLVLAPVGMEEPFVVEVRDGGFDEAALQVADEAFRAPADGPHVHPRLLSLIYRSMLHFRVPYVHLVSGIRRDRGGSRHTHGLAADIVLPGIDDEELAAFFRAQGFTGVGTYTRAGFVHIDVRAQSYFWIDRSPPGKAWRVKPVRGEEARQADADALSRGEAAFEEPPRLSHALTKRAFRRSRHRKHVSRPPRSAPKRVAPKRQIVQNVRHGRHQRGTGGRAQDGQRKAGDGDAQ
jgi:hypothetical protein